MSRGQNIPMEKVELAWGRLRALEMEPWILLPAAFWELEWGTVSPGMSGIGDTSGTGSVPRTGNRGSPLLHLMGAVVSWAPLVSETHFSTIGAEPLGEKLYCCFGHPKTPEQEETQPLTTLGSHCPQLDHPVQPHPSPVSQFLSCPGISKHFTSTSPGILESQVGGKSFTCSPHCCTHPRVSSTSPCASGTSELPKCYCPLGDPISSQVPP